MRLKLLSPSEMSPDQKETYDESIAGKRGAPPAPMMAWLNSPEMARHATRLGGVLRFDTTFPAGNWPRARRGFRGENVRDRTCPFSIVVFCDLSPRMTEFNTSIAPAMEDGRWPWSAIPCMRKAAAIEK